METLSSKQKTFTFNVSLLIAYAYSNGFQLTFGEVYRTLEQQKIYFNSGRSKTMNSNHLNRLAVDFNIFYDGKMLFFDEKKYSVDVETVRPLGEYWESLHPLNRWGADWNKNGINDETFRDPYHFEMQHL